MSLPAVTLAPIIPYWAITSVTFGLLGLLVHGSIVLARKQVPQPWIKLLGAIRVAVILVFLLSMLQPIVSYRTREKRVPDMLVLLDTSRSMARTDGNGGATRLETARTLVRSGGLAAALEDRFRLRFFAFDGRARPLRGAGLESLEPTGETTRLADALSTACAAADPADATAAETRGGPAQRLLVVSDGADLGGVDPAEAARRLGVRVDTIAVGAADDGKTKPRVVITSAQSPRRILLGAEAQFGVALRRDGSDRQPWVLALVEGGRTLVAQDVTFDQGQVDKTVRLDHRPGEAGMHQYEIRLIPKATGTVPADAEPYLVSVQVIDRKHDVLVLEDTWRWEYKFLRRIFEDDPNFSVTAMVSRPGGSVVQMGESDRRVTLAGMPSSRSELDWFDMYVVGDVRPGRWSRGMASGLASLVRDEGKSLVIIAGPNIAEIAETPELAALLPVEVTRESGTPIEGPVEVRVSREGLLTPFFANPPGASGAKPATATAGPTIGPGGLPALDQIYPPLRKKPAATVLVEAVKQANAYGPLIVMAEHTVGRGRVLYIGTDTLWKWHMIAAADDSGITPFVIFWQQALRALAPPRPVGGGVSLYVTPDRSRCEAGQRITVRAEVKSDRPLVAPTIEATVLSPALQAGFATAAPPTASTQPAPVPAGPASAEPLPLAFSPDPAKPGTFIAAFEAEEKGQHRITVAVIAEGRTAAEVQTAIDVEPRRVESDQSPADAATLTRLAAATGGRVIDPADPKTFPTHDAAEAGVVERTASLDLWNNYALMLLLCALLGADWVIRLLKGFV